MTIRKKNTAKSEAPSPRTRSTDPAEGINLTDNKTPKTQSPAAATHKSSAWKRVEAAPTAEPVESSIVGKTTFDAALHEEEIRKVAYCSWLDNGCPQGTEHSDWLAAIEIVRTRHIK